MRQKPFTEFLVGDYGFAKDVLDSLDHQRANIPHWNRRGGYARKD